MSDVSLRRARPTDIDELVEMRREFTFEDVEPNERASRPGYEVDCAAFIAGAISSGRWHIWVAEMDGQIVSHLFVALIDKVPRPLGARSKIAYLTNVYTRPAFRGKGIGTQLVRRAQQAAREADVELMMVWPSEESVEFYSREGFAAPDAPLIWDCSVS